MTTKGLVDWSRFGHDDVIINDVRLHVSRSGPDNSEQPILLMLHGFPDIWSVWARTSLCLPAHWRCVMPDQRGYHLSDKPAEASAYRPQHLMGDVDGLIRHYGSGRPVILIGHDWGGVVAAWYAATHPDQIDKLIMINAVHPVALQQAIVQDAAQRAASAYMEHLASGAAERSWLKDPAHNPFLIWVEEAHRDGRMDSHEFALYQSAFETPENWRAAIDWYRASPIRLSPTPDDLAWTHSGPWQVEAPTLLIWGEQDPVFSPSTRRSMGGFFPRLFHHNLAGIGHNPVRDAPVDVAAAILTFIERG